MALIVQADQFTHNGVLPPGVERLVSVDDTVCKFCDTKFSLHGWIGSRRMCPNSWLVNGVIYQDSEFQNFFQKEGEDFVKTPFD